MKRREHRFEFRLCVSAMLLLLNLSSLAGEEVRQQTFLASDWRFQFNDEPNFENVSFNEVSNWEAISIAQRLSNLDGQDRTMGGCRRCTLRDHDVE